MCHHQPARGGGGGGQTFGGMADGSLMATHQRPLCSMTSPGYPLRISLHRPKGEHGIRGIE